MRKIREILRLKWTFQLSNREIAKSYSTAFYCQPRSPETG